MDGEVYEVGEKRNWTPQAGRVPLVVPVSDGGQRRPCGRRVQKLYLPPGGRQFGCRDCYDLGYETRKLDAKRKPCALAGPGSTSLTPQAYETIRSLSIATPKPGPWGKFRKPSLSSSGGFSMIAKRLV